MSTIQEVATKANVSTATVSRYLNGHKIRPENETRIKEAIESLEYKENYLAKSLRHNKTLNIGILTCSIRDILVTQIVCAMEDVLTEHNYMLTVSNYHNNQDEYESKMRSLINRKIDGLILIDVDPNWELPSCLEDLKIPSVAIATNIKHNTVDSIVSNCASTVHKLTSSLIKHGHKNIGVLTSNTQDYITLDRLKGVYSAIKEANIPSSYFTIKSCECSRKAGYNGCMQLLDKGYDCILSLNFTIGQGALQAIYDERRLVGEDITFATYSYKSLLPVSKRKITAICPKTEEMGRRAAEDLLDMIENNTAASNKVTTIPDEIFYLESIVNKTTKQT